MSNLLEGLKNGCASGLAAGCVKAVMQPFDSMKTLQQFSANKMNLLQAGDILLKRGGIPALYSGLGVTLVGSMPSVGIYFGIYQYCKRRFEEISWMPPKARVVLSAGVGNLVASFFRVPYETVKVRLQTGVYPDTASALTTMYKQGGFSAFFGRGGLVTQLVRDIPYAMVTLLVYDSLQKAILNRTGKSKPSHWETILIGAFAGGVGTLATNPMDVVKTRMMTSPHLYRGAWDVAVTALKNEGPTAFLKGATPRMLHKVPANGLFFVAYEFFRALLGVQS